MNPQTYNSSVRNWARQTKDLMKQAVGALGAEESGELLKKLSFRTKSYKSAYLNTVSFTMPPQGIFSILGVGRGYPLGTARAARAIITGAGTGRVSKDFVNPVLDQQMPDLADRVAEHIADKEVSNFKVE